MSKHMRVPKRIAGVKIPKPIRKGGIGKFLNTTTGQVLLAEALFAAGQALMRKRSDPDSPTGEFLRHPVRQLRTAGHKVADGTRHAAEEVGDRGESLARAFGEAIHAFNASLGGRQVDEADLRKFDKPDFGGAFANEANDANAGVQTRQTGV